MKELKILYLEDSAYDAELAGHMLKKAGIAFVFKLVDTRDEFISALHSFDPDVILSDHSLFQFNSAEALQIFKASGKKIPFILVTGTVSEEFAVTILRQGADDYLLKSNLARLPAAIVNTLEKYEFARANQQYMEDVIANEALLKSAEELANFGSWQHNIGSNSMQWSLGAFRILGYNAATTRLGHQVLYAHVHPEDKALYQQSIINKNIAQSIFSGELRIIDTMGKLKYISFRVMNTFDEQNNPIGQLGFMQDITEKKILEKELAKQTLAQHKLVTATTIQAQERERKFLGQELHDNINQILTGSKIYLRLASQASKEDKKTEFIEKSLEQINQAVVEIRKLSKSLVAPTLGEIGLEKALRELADEINLAQQLKVLIVNQSPGTWNVDEQMELMFYRIAQEQLNNIRKYAHATEAVIHLSADEQFHYFSVSDNGVGFDPTERSKGIGLVNISTRVAFYAGDMKIITAPGKGCSIEIKIPKDVPPDTVLDQLPL